MSDHVLLPSVNYGQAFFDIVSLIYVIVDGLSQELPAFKLQVLRAARVQLVFLMVLCCKLSSHLLDDLEVARMSRSVDKGWNEISFMVMFQYTVIVADTFDRFPWLDWLLQTFLVAPKQIILRLRI